MKEDDHLMPSAERADPVDVLCGAGGPQAGKDVVRIGISRGFASEQAHQRSSITRFEYGLTRADDGTEPVAVEKPVDRRSRRSYELDRIAVRA
jgi:ribosomal protein S9